MKLHHALVCALFLTACGEDAPEPAPPADDGPPAVATEPAPLPEEPAEAAPALPSAAELLALVDQATRIEARSGAGQEPSWSKDLTPEDIASLKAGIGEATLGEGVPRCIPTVQVTLFKEADTLATLGAFCGEAGPSAWTWARPRAASLRRTARSSVLPLRRRSTSEKSLTLA